MIVCILSEQVLISSALQDVHNHVLHCLFHLCFLNTRRQDMAAKHGMIGFLRYVVSFNNSLKEFAVPMLCDLARSRSGTRQILWKEGGLWLFLFLCVHQIQK